MLTIYKLSMTNCVPCRAYAPTFKKVAKEFPEHCWYEEDVTTDSGAEMAKICKIRSVPATIVFDSATMQYTSKTGVMTEQELKEFINA